MAAGETAAKQKPQEAQSMAENYKVTFRMCGSYHLFGYADTLEDAQEMADTKI